MNNERIEGTNLYLEGELTLVDNNGNLVQIFDEGTTQGDIEFWALGYEAGKASLISRILQRLTLSSSVENEMERVMVYAKALHGSRIYETAITDIVGLGNQAGKEDNSCQK